MTDGLFRILLCTTRQSIMFDRIFRHPTRASRHPINMVDRQIIKVSRHIADSQKKFLDTEAKQSRQPGIKSPRHPNSWKSQNNYLFS